LRRADHVLRSSLTSLPFSVMNVTPAFSPAARTGSPRLLREGRRAGGRCDCLDECPRGRAAMGGAFEADATREVMSSRRKTIRAVITRTIIDGSTVDMREAPDWIVLSMQTGDGFDQEATCRAFTEPIASSPALTSGLHRARDFGSGISLKLRQHLAWHKN
jgi:hypothetical protein